MTQNKTYNGRVLSPHLQGWDKCQAQVTNLCWSVSSISKELSVIKLFLQNEETSKNFTFNFGNIYYREFIQKDQIFDWKCRVYIKTNCFL